MVFGSDVAWRWGTWIGQAAGDRFLLTAPSLPAVKFMSAEPIQIRQELAQLRLITPANSDLP